MAIISDKIIQSLQFRIEQEELSSRIYKAMSVWLEFSGYIGAAKLFNKYAEEELKHAGWAYAFLNDLNIMPLVPALTNVQVVFKGLPQIVAISFEHEKVITAQCIALAEEAKNLHDELTYQLSQRYTTEQVEELGKFQYWIDRLNSFGTDSIALRMLDNEMGER